MTAPTNETTTQWFARVEEHRRSLGMYSRMSAWRTWIHPHIGAKRWVDVTVDDVERIRDDLDAAIEQRVTRGPARGVGRLLPSTAIDIWCLLLGAVRVARTSKRRSLRVLAGHADPCDGVEPPGDRGKRHRRKTFVYPVEFLAIASCGSIPFEWRRLHAIAAYTYLRPGELRVLRWSDVDIGRGIIHVSRGWHYELRREKSTKTVEGIRDVPIHEHLAPLLERMRGGPDELVAPLMSGVHRTTLPQVMRRHMLAAGVTREALHMSTLHTVRSNFRSWRDTGLTWLAMSGLDVIRIMRRAGHTDPKTSSRYIKMAEDITGELGKPFPELPRELLEPVAPRQPGSRRGRCVDPRARQRE